MATKAEVLEKVLKLAKEELPYDEYVQFLEIITPKAGDAAKEIRRRRDRLTDEEIIKMLKERKALAVQ